ncbi:hypothetical protein GCM10025857_19240 [Alicyclobacillus contaminans]|nr:hypothetical protein GCM10025857_19240 [Alicyclobacillus contaminans]
MEEQPKTSCLVCHQEKAIGLRICGQFLCADCEREIVATDVSDARYSYYVECMKKIWLAAIS